MNARDDILDRVRRSLPKESATAAVIPAGVQYPDPIEQFAAALGSVGGRCVVVSSPAAADADLQDNPAYHTSNRRTSRVPGIGAATFDLAAIDDPHALADVDFAVLPAELAVAENGAVWAATDSVLERTLYFLSQHLAIVVPADAVVNNMHEAYRRLDVAQRRFGTFISGPSKTADIEQSLVIGAHGARSLTVYLLRKG